MKNRVRVFSILGSTAFLVAGIVCMLTLKDGYFPLVASLFGAAIVAAGWSVFLKAIRNLARGVVFDENFLMTIAAIGAFVLGIVWRNGGEEMMDSALVMILYQVGEFFQSLAVGKSRKNIKSLLAIRPDSAVVIRDGEELEVEPDGVAIGETVIVKAGQRIPIDGIIRGGSGYVDTAAITGESMPTFVKVGDAVMSGSISVDGLLTVETTALFCNSTASRMLNIIEEMSSAKSKQENFITKFAKVYTPCVVAAAFCLAVFPPLLICLASGWSGTVWSHWVYTALTILVISCPCALVISVPITFFCGIGGATKLGVLVKGSCSFEPLTKITTVAFDKTGTLTKGKIAIRETHALIDEYEFRQIAAAAESRFTHPIAQAITRDAALPGANGHTCSFAEDLAGKGVRAVVDGKDFVAGKLSLLAEFGIVVEEIDTPHTVIYCAYNGEFVGYYVISDKVKTDSKAAVDALRSMSIKTVMLTGDKAQVANAIAGELGMNQAYAELLPEEKVKHVRELMTGGEKVLFVGDGINDAPVLSCANMGGAMGGIGSDAAIEVSDLIILSDNPMSVSGIIKHAKRVIRIAMENICGTLGIKIAVLALAIAGVSPGLWFAVLADVGVCLLAILNALRAVSTKKH